MATQDAPPRKRGSRIRLWLALIVVGAVSAFCWQNRLPVQPWPLQRVVPLYAIVLGALGVGFVIGWAARSVLAGRRKATAAQV
jgi:hypothetical protein